MIEPIQGEGGIRPANLQFLQDIKKICEKNNLLLFLDEVQSGFGRSGKLFAHEWANFEPDIVATAKGIGSGFPMGACLSTNKASVGMTKGVHGSTYAGNPLAMSVGIEVIKIILEEGFLENVIKQSNYLWNGLKNIETKYEGVTAEDIKDVVGKNISLVDSGKAAAEVVMGVLKENEILSGEPHGEVHSFITDSKQSFQTVITKALTPEFNISIKSINRIDIG